MKPSDMMPIEHDQAQMWQLNADRRSVRMELPGLPIDGLLQPIKVKITFGRRGRPDDRAPTGTSRPDAARPAQADAAKLTVWDAAMTTKEENVRWMGTPESWDDIVELYRGLETVAFWQADNTLEVETDHGRQRVPVGSWICRPSKLNPDGTQRLDPLRRE
jgi:hypothetical protein